MQLLVYILAYPFLWLLSVLPFPLFYRFSDLTFFLVYHLIGYRRKVVRSNLQLVFPEKSENEIKQIQKKFYRHFCDMFLEIVKTMNLRESDLEKRFRISNIELLQELEGKKGVLLLFPHYGNWEWSIIVNRHIKSAGYAVYQRIENLYFDRLIRKIRAKWNTSLITQQETIRTVMRNEQEAKPGVYGIVSDQSPQAFWAQYWSKFMGVTVPIFNGPETLAKKLDLAVLFARISKEKRGHYALELIPITKAGKNTAENEITEAFLRLTEEQIRNRPEYYLWTHRRWKHRNKVPEKFK